MRLTEAIRSFEGYRIQMGKDVKLMGEDVKKFQRVQNTDGEDVKFLRVQNTDGEDQKFLRVHNADGEIFEVFKGTEYRWGKI